MQCLRLEKYDSAFMTSDSNLTIADQCVHGCGEGLHDVTLLH